MLTKEQSENKGEFSYQLSVIIKRVLDHDTINLCVCVNAHHTRYNLTSNFNKHIIITYRHTHTHTLLSKSHTS